MLRCIMMAMRTIMVKPMGGGSPEMAWMEARSLRFGTGMRVGPWPGIGSQF